MEKRIAYLEKCVAQQGYILIAMIVASAFDTGGLLVLWQSQSKPNFDFIAVSLTIFQMLFGLAALFGFWALRGLTKERAGDVAEEEVRKIVPPLVVRQVEQALVALRDGGTISDVDLAALVKSFPDKEAGSGK